MIRLGFPVRVVGCPGLRSHDGRRAPAGHLSRGLVYLGDILGYLRRIGVRFYRLAPELLPDAAAGTVLQQLDDCLRELDMLAARVQREAVRLTMHLGLEIALGSADDRLAARSLAVIEAQAAFLERLESQRDTGAPLQGVMVVHIGGEAGSSLALGRFATRYMALSERARSRLVVEHDTIFSLGQVLWLHQRCGVPVVFDLLHWQLYNPERLPLELALGLALASWPTTMRAKVHVSTARSEAHLVPAGRHGPARVLPPRPGQHADFVALPDVVQLLRAARGLPCFDVMVEAKAGDLALLRARTEMGRVHPELAALLA